MVAEAWNAAVGVVGVQIEAAGGAFGTTGSRHVRLRHRRKADEAVEEEDVEEDVAEEVVE